MKHRQERMEEAIRETLAEIIMTEVKDPRMPGIFTVSNVKVAPDMQTAKVYFTQIPEDDEEIDQTLDVLERAAGFLRRELTHRISMRHTPQLRFFYDEQDRSTRRIEELLKQANMPPKQEE